MGSDDDDRVSLESEELGEDDSPTQEHTPAAVVPVGTAVALSSARPMTEQSSASFRHLSAVNERIAGTHNMFLERASAKKDSCGGNTVAAAKQDTKSVRRELLGVIEKLAKRVESSESGSAQSKMEIQTLRTKLGYLDERLHLENSRCLRTSVADRTDCTER
ncbi:hypothetical protein B0H10DRAFT_1962547 [Mycena sp. CBHHK59/15]|nr:hypothetical protein B0H10DRAFT_1962547 [Mycena sp. CBHHK59/15]